uniref:Uncharacterized protein n=1 Tax=Parascaris univalens TaxID=6257 RepID=A0A915BMT0_PARUN
SAILAFFIITFVCPVLSPAAICTSFAPRSCHHVDDALIALSLSIMVAISLRSSELLLHAVSFVGIIAALPNYEFIVGESFSKYSTSFPRRPILIPDGTTHAGRFVTAIPEVVRVVPLKRYGPERILFQSEESPDFSNDALRPMLFHKNQEKSMKGSYGIKRVRTVQPTITFSNLEWNKERLQEWRQRRTRVTSGNYGLPEDSISPLHQENDLKQFRQKLFNIKHDQQEINNTKFTMTTRNLPSTTSASSGSKPAQEVTVEDHHITKTITRKVTSVPQFRNIFRIFGLPDRSTDRATTIRSRVNVNEDRTKPRKNPSQTARIFGSAVSAG